MPLTDVRRLLLVEDDPAVCRSITDTLVDEGIEVHPAMSAEQALAAVGNVQPHVVLSDVRMTVSLASTLRQLSQREAVAAVGEFASSLGLGTNWWMMGVSPDGAELAFFRRTAYPQHELMTIPIRGGEPRRVTVLDGERVKSLAWTKDGRSILFEKQDEKSDTARVWRVAATGGKPEPVGLAMERLTQIALSADGRHLAFAAGIGRSELWVMENFLPR